MKLITVNLTDRRPRRTATPLGRNLVGLPLYVLDPNKSASPCSGPQVALSAEIHLSLPNLKILPAGSPYKFERARVGRKAVWGSR